MVYAIKFEVYDNNGILISNNVVKHTLTNPTVADIKSILNNGQYTNIKSEEFLANGGNLNNSDIVNTVFVKYKIYLN